jgi:hypothetical protein
MQCEQAIAKGARLMILSGNTCWWQVRHEDNLRTLVCYRDWNKDPYYAASMDSLVSSVWGRYPVMNPENTFLGSSFENGGYVTDDTLLPASKGYGGYAAYSSHHWIFNETDLRDGDVFGQEEAIVGYENDGALFSWKSGIPVVTTADRCPGNFRILGLSPAAGSDGLVRGHSTMGFYSVTGGGAVFNSASINWAAGLTETDTVVRQITRNIIDNFSRRKSLPPEIISYAPVNLVKDTINYEGVYVSNRIFPLDYTQSDTLNIQAIDPTGKKMHYFWKIGQKIITRDSFCFLTTMQKKNYPNGIALDAFATNGTDTVSVEWTFVNAPLAIVSVPPDTVPSHAKYLYSPKALSKKGEKISYTLANGPSWLHINGKGMMYGSVDTIPGTYQVVLRANDKRGNADTQYFFLQVIDTIRSKDSLVLHNKLPNADSVISILDVNKKDVSTTVECYPNPFTEKSNIDITCEDDARISMQIYDITGALVYTVSDQYALAGNPLTLTWEMNSTGNSKSRQGVYFCRVKISTVSGKNLFFTKKLIAM